MATAIDDRGRRLPRGAWLAAVGVLVVLVVFAPGYGFHRDELYFREAGRNPAFGYPDQPPLVPLLAAAVDAVSGGSIVGVRLAPRPPPRLMPLITAGGQAGVAWRA